VTHSEELVDFVSKATLADLRVVEMSATAEGVGDADTFEIRFDATSRVREDASDLSVEYRVRSVVEVWDHARSPLLKVTSTWGATFRFADNPISTDEAVRSEFQSAVVIMTVYPYIRELVQSTCARFGLPGVVLPLVKASELERVDLAPEDATPVEA